jgi:hypothetical protein
VSGKACRRLAVAADDLLAERRKNARRWENLDRLGARKRAAGEPER